MLILWASAAWAQPGAATNVTVNAALTAAAACTQTFTTANVGTSPYPGDNVLTAHAAGSGSTVLCFASGAYGEIDIYGSHPSGVVTLRPANGATVTGISFNLNGVSNIKITTFSGVSSMNGMTVQVAGLGNNSNITFSYNKMASEGVTISNNAVANANILIDHNDFIGFTSSAESSRVNIVSNGSCPNGITVSNNHMSGGQADGVDISGNSCQTQIISNEIDGIIESNCGGIHCDGIQDNGGGNGTVIAYNYIHNVSDCFLMDDGSSNYNIHDNVCETAGGSSYWMQFGGAATIILNHNTINSSAGAQYGNDHAANPSSNVTFTNNIFVTQPVQNPGEPVSGSFTQNYNLCPSGCVGANSINGTPTYTGGGSPATFAGFVLTGGSTGHLAGSDGLDIGMKVAP